MACATGPAACILKMGAPALRNRSSRLARLRAFRKRAFRVRADLRLPPPASVPTLRTERLRGKGPWRVHMLSKPMARAMLEAM